MMQFKNYSMVVVLGFWWFIFKIWQHFKIHAESININWSAFCIHQVMLLLALLLSFCISLFLEYRKIVLERTSTLINLKAQTHFGLMSSLGPVKSFLPCPWIQAGIVQNLNFDSVHMMRWLGKSNFKYSDQILSLIEKMMPQYPLHANAMLGCLKLMSQQPLCPAYHGLEGHNHLDKKYNPNFIPIFHGNISLIEHAMAVCITGVEMVNHFDYKGIGDEYNKIAKRDPHFQLCITDPMIALIGLSHDIGKLITFKRTSTGVVTEVQGFHGQVGARALAQSFFIKALPLQDQAVLFKVLNFYHHPLDYSLDHEAKIESDRQAALMMLLIKADRRAANTESREAFNANR